MIHHIKNIIERKPYKLLLEFNTGEKLWVDFEEILKQRTTTPESIYRPLLDSDYFNNVKFNAEVKCIYWENGVDFCPDVLYSMAKNKNVQINFKTNA